MRIIRGDTKRIKFQRKDADGNLVTETPAELYFTVKNAWTDEDFIFQKTLADMEYDDDEESETYGFWGFTIRPEDTNGMSYGRYVCDIEVIRDAEKLEKTTIYKDQFNVMGEATWAINEVEES